MPSDDARLAAAARTPDPKGQSRYGVEMTPAEYAEQAARDDRSMKARPLADVVDRNQDELAGFWIDQQRGGEFAVMTLESARAQTRARRRRSSAARLVSEV